ncbi:MAG: IS1595 family transposase [Alteraurantiacibacter sp. bin_em_oilr2.035]|nr:IS1595 family transposase [Alteraurantiacibacter sp. bin_em_oilr2.035]
MKRSGTSIIEFIQRFPNQDACLAHVFNTRWGDHTPCPVCGSFGKWFRIRGKNAYQHKCRNHVQVLRDTVFYRSNIPLTAWFYAILLFANSNKGVRSTFIRKQLGLGLKSSHRLCHRIRLHAAFCARPERLGGPDKMVYIDEALIKQVNTNLPEATPSAIVLGLCCEGQVISGIIPNRRKVTLEPLIERYVSPGSILVTDCHLGYAGLKKRGWRHIAINHSIAFHNFDGVKSAPIETYWAVVKRTMRSYRQASPQHFWEYLALIEFCYNRRNSAVSPFEDLIGSFPELTDESISQVRKRYEWL